MAEHRLALFFGVCAAIYLSEYAKQGRFIQAVRLAILNLAGVPSIVFGLFGFAVFVLAAPVFTDTPSERSLLAIPLGFTWFSFQGWNSSLIAGCATLACMILPVIITASEESLQSGAAGLPRGLAGAGRHPLADDPQVRAALCAARHPDLVDPLASPAPPGRPRRSCSPPRSPRRTTSRGKAPTGPLGMLSEPGPGAALSHLHPGRAHPEFRIHPARPVWLGLRLPADDLRCSSAVSIILRNTRPLETQMVTDHPSPDPARPAIAIDRLCFDYGAKQVLHEVSLDIPAREITAFIGPSGCGKSTLLRCFNRINDRIPGAQVTAGAIRIHGIDIARPDLDLQVLRRRVGMVFQKWNPFPKSIYDNVAYGLRDPRREGLEGARRARRKLPAPRRAVGRGEGPPASQRLRPLRRPAAAALHRPRHRRPSPTSS